MYASRGTLFSVSSLISILNFSWLFFFKLKSFLQLQNFILWLYIVIVFQKKTFPVPFHTYYISKTFSILLLLLYKLQNCKLLYTLVLFFYILGYHLVQSWEVLQSTPTNVSIWDSWEGRELCCGLNSDDIEEASQFLLMSCKS